MDIDIPASGEITEVTRYRANIQRGDGPDQRGDVTVEMVREKDSDPETRDVRLDRSGVDLEAGEDGLVGIDDAPYAEFVYELDRAVAALETALDLDEDDG